MALCKLEYLAKWNLFYFFMVYFNILKSKVLVHWIEPTARFEWTVHCLWAFNKYIKNFDLDAVELVGTGMTSVEALKAVVGSIQWTITFDFKILKYTIKIILKKATLPNILPCTKPFTSQPAQILRWYKNII